jgi:hypothetical protein
MTIVLKSKRRRGAKFPIWAQLASLAVGRVLAQGDDIKARDATSFKG